MGAAAGLAGFDTDCNGAAVGSVFGLAGGIDSIASKWSAGFAPMVNSSVHGYHRLSLDELCRRTEIGMELDIYWAYDAGRDPLALMDALGWRLMAVHLKDGLPGGEGKPLGQGTAPVKAVWEKAREKRIPIIVESETLTPDGLTEAKICMDYLRELEK